MTTTHRYWIFVFAIISLHPGASIYAATTQRDVTVAAPAALIEGTGVTAQYMKPITRKSGDKGGNSEVYASGDKAGNTFLGGDKGGNADIYASGDKGGNTWLQLINQKIGETTVVKNNNDLIFNGLKFYSGDAMRTNYAITGGDILYYKPSGKVKPHDEAYAKEVLHRNAIVWPLKDTRVDILRSVMGQMKKSRPQIYNLLKESEILYGKHSWSYEYLSNSPQIRVTRAQLQETREPHDVGIDLQIEGTELLQAINWRDQLFKEVNTNQLQLMTLIVHHESYFARMTPSQQAWMDFSAICLDAANRQANRGNRAPLENTLEVQKWTSQLFSEGPIDWSFADALFGHVSVK